MSTETKLKFASPLLRPFTLGVQYSKLWVSQTISALSDNIVGMALSIIVLERTGSATAVSVGLLLQMLPALLVGPIAGVILDRAQKKRVIMFSDAARACSSLYAAYAIYSGSFSLMHVYGWMLVNGVVRAFFDPATNALIPALVEGEDIQRANAVLTVGKNTAMILGPAAGGLALASIGGAWTLAAGAIAFMTVGVIISSVVPVYEERIAPLAKRPSLSEAMQGLNFYKTVPLAMKLLIMAVFINFCAMPSGLAFQVHVLKVLGANSDLLGFGFTISAAASMVTSYIMAARKKWPRLGLTMGYGVAAMAASFACMGVSRTLLQAYASFALFGASTPFIQVPMSTLYQQITPAEIRGRVFALRFTVSTFFSPISTPLVGFGLDKLGSPAILTALAGLMAIVSMGGLSNRALREA